MSLETQVEGQIYRTAADRVKKGAHESTLFKRPRPFESIIRYVLLTCGLVSVLTTIGIVIVLAGEALRFFTNYGFVSSVQQLTEAVDETETILKLNGIGSPARQDQIIRIGEEAMKVVRVVDAQTLEVQRGALRTRPESHPVTSTMFLGEQVSIVEFLTGTRWIPQAASFGVLPLVMATLTTSFIALMIAGPVGLGVAVYLSEYATARRRAILKPILEILAAIPTVVYGYFALTFVTPILQGIFVDSNGTSLVGSYNQLSAGLVMGVMIIPTIASISEDA